MTTALPDRPVVDVQEDLLGRAPFAASLSNLIADAPVNATLRIGIYGGWGEGKTSVLGMMHTQLVKTGHVCVWLLPWVAASEDDFVNYLMSEVAHSLNIRLKRFGFKAAQGASRSARALRQFSGQDYRLKLADVIVGAPIQSMFDKLAGSQTASLQKEINTALRGRKLIVFVDDLDRVRPRLVPSLLLTLREVLDRPDFFYVMGLAPDVVERGLRSVHEGWGETNDFLEKIVEFPAYLPEPKPADLQRFVTVQLEKLGTAVDPAAILRLGELLPRNPRKLKLFLRYLASLHTVIARFGPEEMDWWSFYLAQLLKIEFPLESRALVADPTAIHSLQDSVVDDFVAKRDQESGGEDNGGSAPRPEEQHAPQGPNRERFIQICEALRKRPMLSPAFHSIQSIFAIPEESPSVTFKEAEDLLERMTAVGKERAAEILSSFLKRGDINDPGRIAGLWQAVLHLRQIRLDNAASVQHEAEVIDHLREAGSLLSVLQALIVDVGVFRDNALSADQWFAMFGHFSRWAHFQKLEYYKRTRQSERSLIIASLDYISSDIAEELLDPMRLHGSPTTIGETPDFDAMAIKARALLQRRVSDSLVECFSRESCIHRFWAIDRKRGGKSVLFSSDSLLLTDPDYRTRLAEIADRASESAVVQENFLEYFRMLTYGAFEGGGSFGRSDCQEILKDAGLVSMVWGAAVGRPLNPRTAGSLRIDRENLLKSGIPPEKLPTPSWWDVLEKEFFPSGERTESD